MALQSLTERLLFTEPFEFQVNIPIQECVHRLQKLEKPRESWWKTSSRLVVVNSTYQGAYDFDIRMMRTQRAWDYTSVKAVGRIEPGNGKTLIRGEIKLGVFYYLGVISIAVAFLVIVLDDFSRMRSSSAFLIAVIGGVIFAYYIWTLVSDRSTLKQLLYAGLDTAPPK